MSISKNLARWLIILSLLPGSALAELMIEGQVTADGEPAAGARVELTAIPSSADRGAVHLDGLAGPEPATATAADSRGFFQLAAPKVGMWSVRVEAADRAPAEYRIQPLLENVDLPTLDLEDAAAIDVEVRDPDGKALDARVAAFRFRDTRFTGRRRPDRRSRAWSLPVFVGRTGKDGKLSIPVEGQGQYFVRVVASGFLPAERELRQPSTARFQLETGRARPLRTVDAGGKAVPGVLVYDEADSLLPLAATGADGRLTVAQGAEPLRLRFAGADGRRGDVTLDVDSGEDDSEEVAVTLEEPLRITGRVIDRETRRPIGGALVWGAGLSGDFVHADGDGAYTLTGKSQRNAVWAAAQGYASSYGDLRQGAGEEAETRVPTLALTPCAVVSGRVVDADGNALADVEVIASAMRDMSPGRMVRMLRNRMEPKTSRSSRRGAFRLGGLPAGASYELRFRLDGYAEQELSAKNLKAFEERTDLHVVLERGRRGTGVVLDAEAAPLPGAIARLKRRPEAQGGGRMRRVMILGDSADDEDAAFLTGREGRFEIPDLAGGSYDLEVEASGFSRATIPGIEVPEDVSEVDLGTVVMTPGVEITGVVRDAEGQPLAAAEVRVGGDSGMPVAFLSMRLSQERPRARSDARGRFSVGDLREGEKVHVLVSRAGFVDTTVAGVVAPTVEPLEVVMKPASNVSGKVVDEDGHAIEDAQVRVDAEGRRGLGRRARSRQDGTFEIEDVAPGRVNVTAEASGYQSYSLSGLEVPDGADLRDVTLTLAPGAVIEGTVFAPDGRPVIGANVRSVVPGTTERFSFGGLNTTDGDGRYWIDGIPIGPRTVIAEHDVYQRVARDLEVEKGANRVDLIYEGGVDVSGSVIGPQGEPITDAVVTLEGSGRFFFLGSSQEARTGAGGAFMISGVQAGQYVARAAKEGFAMTRTPDPIAVGESPVQGVEIRLTTGATLSGEVLGLGVDDLAGLRITAGTGRNYRVGDVNFEGRYQVFNLSPGDWRVSAEVESRGRRASGNVTVSEDDTEVSLDLEFGAGYMLSGTVLATTAEAGSQPMAGAWVIASNKTGGNRARATTSQDGTFRLEDLEEGTYDLSVTNPSLSGMRHREEIEVTGDDDVLIELVLARLAGWVTNAFDKTPVAGARIRVEALDGEDDGAIVVLGGFGNETDSRGFFSVSNVPEGAWKLVAQRSGFGPAETVVDVAGEDASDLALEMTPTEGLYFEVTLAMGGSPNRVNAAVLRTPGATDDVVVSGWGIETGENGRVQMSEVPPGSFELLVSAPGTVVVAVPAVSPGQLGRVVLPMGGRLRLKVPELDEQPSSSRVTLVGPTGQPYKQISYGGRVVTEASVNRLLEGLDPGLWRITVTAHDGRSWSGQTQVVALQTSEVVLD